MAWRHNVFRARILPHGRLYGFGTIRSRNPRGDAIRSFY